ncbi:PP2C family protein-serine/threonine phosphatase [Saccharomonospora xinjiangensis]|uniref:Serine phosphatase RsbU, regulator of sigma subunit n=1 Tax=Saccharomonospora xinjiangensis XJ-54 TaxID=882086 RepID=I0V3V2_9PSEU|nr:PP2C family protein-serine/threonine phosphatase [Saccharomonospora xinjiangensis]EID54805.1 serine phosphatase RsbU, regulator of sigma subunit [Saccharomonospora xinjiangensis XJ-54]
MNAAFDQPFPESPSLLAGSPRPGDWAHVRFIEGLSRQLAGALNVRRAAYRALDFAIPYLGDWGMLAFFDADSVSVYSQGRNGRVAGPVLLGRLDPLQTLGRFRRRGVTERYAAPQNDIGAVLAELIPSTPLLEEAEAHRPSAVLAVALTIGGVTNGVFVVVRGGGSDYTASDAAAGEEFARRVSTTLESARLYEERAQTAEALEQVLRPPELPQYPGVFMAARYRPGEQRLRIGGDFYDVHGDADDFTVVIGDVCGKGIDAAVFTSLARQTIRTAAFFDRSPARVLGALNEVLRTQLSQRFVTAACARFLRRPGERVMTVTVSVAGHPPPLVLRADGTVEEFAVAGTVAGIVSGLSFTEAELGLGAKDTILLHTDGVEEARGREGFFGHDRLRLMLPEYAGASPGTLCEAVEQRVLEHLDGAAHDDIAVIAVQNGA